MKLLYKANGLQASANQTPNVVLIFILVGATLVIISAVLLFFAIKLRKHKNYNTKKISQISIKIDGLIKNFKPMLKKFSAHEEAEKMDVESLETRRLNELGGILKLQEKYRHASACTKHPSASWNRTLPSSIPLTATVAVPKGQKIFTDYGSNSGEFSKRMTYQKRFSEAAIVGGSAQSKVFCAQHGHATVTVKNCEKESATKPAAIKSTARKKISLAFLPSSSICFEPNMTVPPSVKRKFYKLSLNAAKTYSSAPRYPPVGAHGEDYAASSTCVEDAERLAVLTQLEYIGSAQTPSRPTLKIAVSYDGELGRLCVIVSSCANLPDRVPPLSLTVKRSQSFDSPSRSPPIDPNDPLDFAGPRSGPRSGSGPPAGSAHILPPNAPVGTPLGPTRAVFGGSSTPLAAVSERTGRTLLEPFIKVKLLNDKWRRVQRTRTVKNSLNPVFDESFVFQNLLREKLHSCTLHFSVLSGDKFLTNWNDLVGEAICSLNSVDLSQSNKIVPMTLNLINQSFKFQNLKNRGDLLISTCFQPEARKIDVLLMKARNLPVSDSYGLADPLVKIYLFHNGQQLVKKKSRVVKRTISPTFNETFELDLPKINSSAENDQSMLNNFSLEFAVFNWDRIRRNQFLGRVKIGRSAEGSTGAGHWAEMVRQPRKKITQWHTLKAY